MRNPHRFRQNFLRSEVSPHGVNRSWYLRRRWAPRRRWVILAGTLGLIWLASPLVVGEQGILRLLELKDKEDELSAELHGLEEEARRLDEEIDEEDALAIERTAREKFDLQRQNEIVFRFPRVATGTDTVGNANRSASSVDTTEVTR